MNILFLRGFNNYFNRIVKKYSTLTDYENNSTSYVDFKNINFNPNDGVATELIVGSMSQKESNKPLAWDVEGTPDYLICYETTNGTDSIVSRWFILESERTRDGQYRLALKRDVIAEHFSNIMNAPCFVEKGIINNKENPLLFNNEGMTYNQIKKTETPLKDETGCGWVVGYIPGNAFEEEKTITKDVVLSTSNADIEVNGLSTWSYWQYVTTNPNYKRATNMNSFSPQTTVKYKHIIEEYNDSGPVTITFYHHYAEKYTFNRFSNNGTPVELAYSRQNPPSWWNNYHLQTRTTSSYLGPVSRVFSNIYSNSTYIGYQQSLLNSMQSYSFTSAATINAIRALRSKIIFDSTNGNYYRIDIVERTEDRNVNVTANSSSEKTNILNFINNNVLRTGGAFDNFVIDGTNVAGDGDVEIYFNNTYYAIDLTQISVPCTVTIDNDRFHLEDSPYDMFCIPYSDTLQLRYGSGESQVTFTCKKAVALAMASAIAEQSGDGSIYDVQLLPYCPARHVIAGSPNPGTMLLLDTTEYDLIKHNNDPVSAIIWCMSSSFQVPINLNINPGTSALELKVSNECDMYRLCSGNYNGLFEFSAAKSKGIAQFMAECTYKPYSPYIHVTPILKGLYELQDGTSYRNLDDSRGLICGGEFSLPQVSNAWANYELNNKNYQKMFDRQLQNLDTNNAIAKEQLDWQGGIGALTSGIGGAAGGALAGAKLGGPYGAAAGAIAGGLGGPILSGLGYEKDKDWLARQQAETRNYAIDMYNYQLGNIKAIPNSLSKSSALTWNTRIWPFVEHYTCTDTEKQALREKLKYNGMTIMKIDNLINYSASTDFDRVYLKGQLISLEGINDDFHIADAIYAEVNKGFYVLQEGE